MNKDIILKVNETYSFLLDSHGGGGYSWLIVLNNEEITEVQLKSSVSEHDINLTPLGKNYPIEVNIKALAKGQSFIVLEERRGWEPDATPLSSCKLIVTIK